MQAVKLAAAWAHLLLATLKTATIMMTMVMQAGGAGGGAASVVLPALGCW
jgi:hypothetical protein